MLREFQQDFARGLGAGDRDEAARRRVESLLVPLPKASPARGVEIYQSAMRRVVEDGLRELFPVCAALVGEDCFRQIATRLATDHPSTSPDLGRIGDDLPELLPRLRFLDGVPYLSDVARLEWARHRAVDAAEPQRAVDPEGLASAMAEEPEAWRFCLRPSFTLVESRYPVAAIWAAHQVSEEDAVWPSLEGYAGERLAVWRDEAGVQSEPVCDRRGRILGAVADGLSIGAILDSVDEGRPSREAGFAADETDPQALLLDEIADCFSRGWITGIERLRGVP